MIGAREVASEELTEGEDEAAARWMFVAESKDFVRLHNRFHVQVHVRLGAQWDGRQRRSNHSDTVQVLEASTEDEKREWVRAYPTRTQQRPGYGR